MLLQFFRQEFYIKKEKELTERKVCMCVGGGGGGGVRFLKRVVSSFTQ